MRDDSDAVLAVVPLGFPWQTLDPFLFCAHHNDAYPVGGANMAPRASLQGRDIGQDFAGKDGWRMYHGDVVPGFPQHPHRGFETITIVKSGLVDHTDSLGATARFGAGDVQWLTAGKGIVHSEMFPLVNDAAPNPLELFQVWLNLPRANKMVEPHFKMLWRDAVPTVTSADAQGRKTVIDVVAGRLREVSAPAPPPQSWAVDPRADIAVWTLAMDPYAAMTLPRAQAGSNRVLYFFRGTSLSIVEHTINVGNAVQLRPDVDVRLVNGAVAGALLLLQGRPLAEPVAQHGPFVMNTQAEIQQAFDDYRRTGFGGWRWPSNGPVHPRSQGRFAKHPDGSIENARDG